MKTGPLVSVITPCYNGEPYLKECIESVLVQSYSNFEYIIVDNKSDDGSLKTAERYAKLDSRIRVLSNETFLRQLENFNHAFCQMSDQSVYCKIVQADDWMYPNCLAKMVELAESNPSVGIVSSYTLLDHGDHTRVYLTGLPHSSTVITGREACRRFLLDGTDCFGNPTVTLIRSKIIRSADQFYDEKSVSPDTDVCFRVLMDFDFGFVHQILTYTRRYNDSIMSILSKFHHRLLTELIIINKYGDAYLEQEELKRRYREIESNYEKAIGESLLRRLPKQFWQFHREALAVIGYELGYQKLTWCLAITLLDLALNPKQTLERLMNYRPRKTEVGSRKIKDYYDLDVK